MKRVMFLESLRPNSWYPLTLGLLSSQPAAARFIYQWPSPLDAYYYNGVTYYAKVVLEI